MSPTVFREGPIRYFFFSREEPRIHIHALGPQGEAKFWIFPAVSVANNCGFSDEELNRLIRTIEAHKEEIVNA